MHSKPLGSKKLLLWVVALSVTLLLLVLVLVAWRMDVAGWRSRIGHWWYKTAEASQNMAAIRSAQERYFSEHGVYLECKPSPTDGGTDAKYDRWNDNGGFAEIGFEPDGRVRYQYEVKVSRNGQSFIAIAVGDLDDDGLTCAFLTDRSSRMYPKMEKDTAGLYSDGDDL